MKRDAACYLTPILRHKKTAAGWNVVSGKSGEFLIEILEAQAEAERLGILEKKFSR